MKSIASLAVLLLFSSCSTKSSSSLPSSLPDWSPDLSEPISLVEGWLQKSDAQQDMNYLSSSLASIYDAQLWSIFHSRLEKLEGEARSQCLEQQRQWLKLREQAMTEAYQDYGGGSGAPLAAADTSIEMTKKRIAEFVGEAP
jgi:uncharacterized protein YecT (DUF1311 family)